MLKLKHYAVNLRSDGPIIKKEFMFYMSYTESTFEIRVKANQTWSGMISPVKYQNK